MDQSYLMVGWSIYSGSVPISGIPFPVYVDWCSPKYISDFSLGGPI